MANRLTMDKSLAMKALHAASYSERRIAETLYVSPGAVRRHLADQAANITKAQTGPAQTAPKRKPGQISQRRFPTPQLKPTNAGHGSPSGSGCVLGFQSIENPKHSLTLAEQATEQATWRSKRMIAFKLR